MSVASRVFARLAGLPPAQQRDVVVERDLEAEMPDGAVLLADRWAPRAAVPAPPVVLIRSPYGRRGMALVGRVFAERGYQVVVQSCRGTFGSGGEWEPFFHERADGRATLDWLTGQPWFTGSLATFGPSYMGLTQWAMVSDPPGELRAMALQITAARVRDSVVFPGGSFSLETGACWLHQLEFQERGPLRMLWAVVTSRHRMAPAFRTLPLAEADTRTLGRRVDCYQSWLEHERPGDPWWDPIDFSRELTKAPPASLLGGWYDVFLPEQVEDYCRLRDAGRHVRLRIGPWTHSSLRAGAAGVRDALDWFDACLRRPGAPGRGSASIRLYLMGAGRWVDVPDWPPPATVQRWSLHPGGGLSAVRPPPGPPDRYRYDPADPTPAVGGASLDPWSSGPRSQRRRERRGDVLSYTSEPLTADVTVVGPLTSELWLRSSRPHTDVFVRLCDVKPSGRSRNLSDGILRIDATATPANDEGIRCVRVTMWPTANTFRRGHRIRLQVSSGAHPLFARNTGSGERLATASTLLASDQEVFHDPRHPSGIELPVCPRLSTPATPTDPRRPGPALPRLALGALRRRMRPLPAKHPSDEVPSR